MSKFCEFPEKGCPNMDKQELSCLLRNVWDCPFKLAKIEEVKKVIWNNCPMYEDEDEFVYRFAQQICQLLESKPDESRLLPDDILRNIIFQADKEIKDLAGHPYQYNEAQFVTFSKQKLQELLEAQDAKTASIKDAENQDIYNKAFEQGKFEESQRCQQRVERIYKKIESQMSIEDYTRCYDEGVPQLGTKRVITDEKWQALKKEEGVE